MAPDLPISAPRSFSVEIAKRVGRFSTLGIAEDTAALRQGVFDLPEFLTQSRMVLRDERKLLDDSLAGSAKGSCFSTFPRSIRIRTFYGVSTTGVAGHLSRGGRFHRRSDAQGARRRS